MHSALRHFMQAICVLTLLAIIATAQQPATQPATGQSGTGTIQGRVTLEKAPQPGVIVMLVPSQSSGDLSEVTARAPVPTALTDGDGNFQFAKVKAGKYHLQVHTPVYVVEDGAGDEINLGENETVDHQDFALRRGGVITGKVLDPDGHPVIEANVSLFVAPTAEGQRGHFISQGMQTDDRGVFRVFGIPAGDYKVIANLNEEMGGFFNSPPEFQRTYYPNAATEEDAKAVSVRAEVETSGIEITLLRAKDIEKSGVTISGRVVAADTAKAVSGSMVVLVPTGETPKNARPAAPATTNGNGEFKFEGISNGDYIISLMNIQEMVMGASKGYAEPLKVSVADTAISGLEIKMKAGASLSGVVALETKPGARPDASQLEMLSTLMIMAMPYVDGSSDKEENFMGMMDGFGMTTVKPDQTFQFSGLKHGKYKFNAESMAGKKLKILRFERNGVSSPFVEVQDSEQVKNVRLVFALGSASVKGRVQVQGAALPTGSSFSIKVTRQGENRPDERDTYTQSDGRGNFSLDGLLPGTYEIKVMSVHVQGEAFFEYEMPTQTLTLFEHVTQEVVLYVNLIKKEKQ